MQLSHCLSYWCATLPAAMPGMCKQVLLHEEWHSGMLRRDCSTMLAGLQVAMPDGFGLFAMQLLVIDELQIFHADATRAGQPTIALEIVNSLQNWCQGSPISEPGMPHMLSYVTLDKIRAIHSQQRLHVEVLLPYAGRRLR